MSTPDSDTGPNTRATIKVEQGVSVQTSDSCQGRRIGRCDGRAANCQGNFRVFAQAQSRLAAANMTLASQIPEGFTE